jgi:ATP-dependent Lon protease
MYDPFGVFATSSLRPEPIPLNIKLIVVGNPLVYHLFQFYDEDFSEIFKIKADFGSELDGISQPELLISRFVRKLKDSNDILPFDPGAVAELCIVSTRMAGEKGKLTAEMSKLADIVRESSFWAKKENASIVNAKHVQKAIDEKIYRSNQIAERMREYIANGTILLNVAGKVTGQINGLSIIQLGDYSFGRPTRVTASIGVGNSGIINIERESHLSGSSYDKAMMILEGYLRNTYAINHPIALSASITMEQSYGLIEGDSATISELICLLSAISGIPLRQDIAITGSVNQWGEIQAVGGIIQKIEGFFEVCKMIGLTGEQGVCIPESNVRNLILRHDVIEAIQEKKFHIWSVRNVNDAIGLLTDTTPGSIEEVDSFHYSVDQKFYSILKKLKEQQNNLIERETASFPSSPQKSKDPRPRMPGEDRGFF